MARSKTCSTDTNPGRAVLFAALGFSIVVTPAAVSANQDAEREAFIAEVTAIDADPAFGEYLANQCSTCHGSSSTGRIPPIRGLPADYFAGALYEYREDIRANDVMKNMAAGLSDEEIAALAAYYSALEPR